MSEDQLQALLAASRASVRKRLILPFHKRADELLHRMFNALQPGTYVQPHRHLSPPKVEAFVVLRGMLDFVVFHDDGEIQLAQRLAAQGRSFGIDLAPGCFHSFVVREPDTLVYEVKQGPYSAADDKDFATWAPAEGAPGVADYQRKLDEALSLHGLTSS
jgi:cupin fold WbuC family metalloprotein